MNNATAKNEIQALLQEYIGRRKATSVGEKVYEVMHGETKHTHNGETVFISKNESGVLIVTNQSMVKLRVEAILSQNLGVKDVRECLEQLFTENDSVQPQMIGEIETISVEGSDSKIYSHLLKHTPVNDWEKKFLDNLKNAIEAGVKPFNVPVYDPSIDENGYIQFVAGCNPAVGYSYGELKELANKNGVKLGSKKQYVLFLATIIHRLIEEGWTKKSALHAVCTDSAELGHYCDSANAKDDFELTGSREVAGKFDLANTYKILAEDEKAGDFWLAGGRYSDCGDCRPLADIDLNGKYVDLDNFSVGWFVL